MSATPASCSVDLQPLHTFGLKACAQHVHWIKTQADLMAYAQAWRSGQPGVLLGEGSNTVFVSPSVAGTVWRMAIQGKQYLGVFEGCHHVRVQAGENWHHWVEWSIAQGWFGLENLALIPGTVGASPVQNIGAYGVEVKDRVGAVHVLDALTGEMLVWSNEACQFAYRDSVFKHSAPGRYVITAVDFVLPVRWVPVLSYGDVALRAAGFVPQGGALCALHVMKAVCEIRAEKLPDPAVLGNSGSFFKNPVLPVAQFEALKALYPQVVSFPVGQASVKLAAGWLIDQCGLKGVQHGGVRVYDKQALILVNAGEGTGGDLLALIAHIQTQVQARFGVWLEPEPSLV